MSPIWVPSLGSMKRRVRLSLVVPLAALAISATVFVETRPTDGAHAQTLVPTLFVSASGAEYLHLSTASDWLSDRPALDPLTYAALRFADESARGVGIWQGCLRARDPRSLLAARPPRGERR